MTDVSTCLSGREDETSDPSLILEGTWVELGHAAVFLWRPCSSSARHEHGWWLGDSGAPPLLSYKVTQARNRRKLTGSSWAVASIHTWSQGISGSVVTYLRSLRKFSGSDRKITC